MTEIVNGLLVTAIAGIPIYLFIQWARRRLNEKR